jgi:hypothetical protein
MRWYVRAERFQVLREARGEGGGTIPPHMYNYLKEMHGWKSDGKFKLMEEVQVERVEWIPSNQVRLLLSVPVVSP